MTSNQSNSVAAGLRSIKGRTFFEPNLRHKLQDLAKSLRPFYKVKLIEIDSIDKTEILNPNGKVWRPLFYCDNIPGLIDFVSKERGHLHNTELFLKVGLNNAGSWLKVCVNFEKAQSHKSCEK